MRALNGCFPRLCENSEILFGGKTFSHSAFSSKLVIPRIWDATSVQRQYCHRSPTSKNGFEFSHRLGPIGVVRHTWRSSSGRPLERPLLPFARHPQAPAIVSRPSGLRIRRKRYPSDNAPSRKLYPPRRCRGLDKVSAKGRTHRPRVYSGGFSTALKDKRGRRGLNLTRLSAKSRRRLLRAVLLVVAEYANH